MKINKKTRNIEMLSTFHYKNGESVIIEGHYLKLLLAKYFTRFFGYNIF